MQPPSHPALADFDALWKLALLLKPKDVLRRERWSRKFGQDDKWSVCLTAGYIGPRIQERR